MDFHCTEPGKNGLIVIPDSQKENAEWLLWKAWQNKTHSSWRGEI